MSSYLDLLGTTSGSFSLAKGGVIVKNNSGALAIRNSTDSADADSSCAKLSLSGALNEAPTVTIASASTVNIGAAASSQIIISGTTTITAFDSVAAGIIRTVTFSGILTLTHNATNLILPGNVNITTAVNDSATFRSLGSGNWICINYKKQNGFPVVDPNTPTNVVRINSAADFPAASGGVRALGDFTYIIANTAIDMGSDRFTTSGNTSFIGSGPKSALFTSVNNVFIPFTTTGAVNYVKDLAVYNTNTGVSSRTFTCSQGANGGFVFENVTDGGACAVAFLRSDGASFGVIDKCRITGITALGLAGSYIFSFNSGTISDLKITNNNFKVTLAQGIPIMLFGTPTINRIVITGNKFDCSASTNNLAISAGSSFSNNSLCLKNNAFIGANATTHNSVQISAPVTGQDISDNQFISCLGFGGTNKTIFTTGAISATTTLVFEYKATKPGSIQRTITKASATTGTVSARWQINGVNVGSTANTVTSTENIQTHSSNNAYAIDAIISCVVTVTAGSFTDCSFVMQ